MYTQHATGFLRENADSDPPGLSSLFDSLEEDSRVVAELVI